MRGADQGAPLSVGDEVLEISCIENLPPDLDQLIVASLRESFPLNHEQHVLVPSQTESSTARLVTSGGLHRPALSSIQDLCLH